MPSSDVVGKHFETFDRETLRDLKLQALRDDIQRGADSGAGVPAKKAFADVRKRIATESAARAPRR